MARKRNCLPVALKLVGDKLVPAVVEKYYDRAQEIKDALVLGGDTDNLMERVAQRLQTEMTDKKIAAAEKKRQAAQGIIALKQRGAQAKDLRNQGVSGYRSLFSLFYGTQQYVKNGRVSWARQVNTYRKKFLAPIEAAVGKEKPYLWKLMRNKEFDNAVTKELHEMKPGGKPGVTGNSDALWLAQKLAAGAELARTEGVKHGMSIDKMHGYLGPLIHDNLAYFRATLPQWKADIRKLVDLSATFPRVLNAQELEKELDNFWTEVVTGDRKDPARITYLKFNTAEDAIKYRDLYGGGSTVMGFFGHQEKMAHIVAGMEWFGASPRTTMQKLIKEVKAELEPKLTGETSTRGRVLRTLLPSEQERLRKDITKLDISKFEADLNLVSGQAMTPPAGNMGWAKLHNNIRSGIGIAKMGKALFSSFNDVTSAASQSFYSGRGYWNGVFEHLGGMFEHMTNPEIREFSHVFGEGADGQIGHLAAAHFAEDGPVGAIGQHAHRFFRWSLLTGWTDTGRASAARAIASHLGYNAGNSWDKLNWKHQHVLEANGITPEKWEVLRQAAQVSDHGKTYITPDMVRALTDEQVSGLKMAPKEARRTLEMDLLGYVADEMDYAIPAVGMRERRFLHQGERPGTAAGEVLRYLTQLKGYPAAYTLRILGRALNAPMHLSLDQKILWAAPHLGSLIAGMTVTGFISTVVSEAALGIWPPRNPFSWDTIKLAIQRGGGLGILGDYVLGQTNTYNHPAAFGYVGPAVGTGADIIDLAVKMRDGDKFAGEAFTTLVNNTPYANLFWLRPALDILAINALHESVSPGYLARQQSRLHTTTGQSYQLPRTFKELTQ